MAKNLACQYKWSQYFHFNLDSFPFALWNSLSYNLFSISVLLCNLVKETADFMLQS